VTISQKPFETCTGTAASYYLDVLKDDKPFNFSMDVRENLVMYLTKSDEIRIY